MMTIAEAKLGKVFTMFTRVRGQWHQISLTEKVKHAVLSKKWVFLCVSKHGLGMPFKKFKKGIFAHDYQPFYNPGHG